MLEVWGVSWTSLQDQLERNAISIVSFVSIEFVKEILHLKTFAKLIHNSQNKRQQKPKTNFAYWNIQNPQKDSLEQFFCLAQQETDIYRDNQIQTVY